MSRVTVIDPVARLFDAVRDFAATRSMQTGEQPRTRIEYESDGGRAFTDRHQFRVYIDDEVVAEVARPSLSHAAHQCWVDVQQWANGQPDALFVALSESLRGTDP